MTPPTLPKVLIAPIAAADRIPLNNWVGKVP